MQLSVAKLRRENERRVKERHPILGSPLASTATAVLVVNAKWVLGAYLHAQRHDWVGNWAGDLVWESTSNRWLFGFLSYGRSELHINVFDVGALRSDMSYPLRFKPSYKVRWPRMPAPSWTAHKTLESDYGDIRRLGLGTVEGQLTAAVFHRTAGVLTVPIE